MRKRFSKLFVLMIVAVLLMTIFSTGCAKKEVAEEKPAVQAAEETQKAAKVVGRLMRKLG